MTRFEPRALPSSRSASGPTGFTLLEMLMVMLIVAVLAAVALPGYQSHVRKARRAEARTALLRAAHWMERQATVRGLYPDAGLPQDLELSINKYYRIVRRPPNDEDDAGLHFWLEAVPQGVQASDACGSFTLSHAGERGVTGPGASASDCWSR
ncbi:type IV pilin protein [Variovorax dokdonensis]|uniref:Type IV pilin protein n=1 Tax=Variovorax dokdonensis TaxID=344883 RepID=A0ABT7NCY7_9BURK|nr:type IV pilin protein [Variovorax dokdonensis]MDM0045826.1 type IV pilin protein [Variovorax dokdonensis]